MAVSQEDIGIVKMTAVADAITGIKHVNFIRWVAKGATGGEDLLVYNTDDKTILEAVADGANFEKDYPIKQSLNGVKVSAIGAGSIYIHLAPENPRNW